MAAPENNKLLDYILVYAKNDLQGQPMTATHFLYYALRVYQGTMMMRPTEEQLQAFRQLIDAYIPRYDDNAGLLTGYVERQVQRIKEAPASVTIHFPKQLYYARQLAASKGHSEIEVTDVLEQLFKNPDAPTRAFLSFADRMGELSAEVETETREEEQTQPHEADKMAEALRKFREAEEKAKKETKTEAKTETTAEEDKKALVQELTEKAKHAHAELSKKVLGQENAISVFTTGFFRAELAALTDRNRQRPRATFLFAGPPGVGKTYLAESIADLIGVKFQVFDMSGYSDKEAPLEFAGSDNVYKDSKCGNVTGFVAENPHCVLLFDEIEKAHINVIHLFLQILDKGRLRDGKTDEEVSFADSIIIFTTNAGKQLYQDSETPDLSVLPRKTVLKALENDVNPTTKVPYFPPAICSRFASGNVVMFNHITAEHLRRIAKNEILRHAESLEKTVGLKVEIEESIYTALLFSEGGACDARTMRSRAESFFDGELYELFRLLELKKDSIRALEKITVTASLPKKGEPLLSYFVSDHKPEALVVSSRQVADKCAASCESVSFVPAQTAESLKKVLRTKDIGFALIDLSYKRRGERTYLNIEDVDSAARDLFWFLREKHAELPVYVLQSDDTELSEEEKTSFRALGVRGFVSLTEDLRAFGAQMQGVAEIIHRQNKMNELARSNKMITFETAQTVSDDGKCANIKLFDFELSTAVDAEDQKDVLSNVSKPDTRFDRIIGAADAKEELAYFVEYLKNPKRYLGTGVSTPKGVLLYGPPGTGKTMLAKATAAESNVTFIAAEGNQFLKSLRGEGAEAVHALFRTARKYAPSILFIDEVDAIGKTRSGDTGTDTGEILTAFLTEMDGFKKDSLRPVFVLAATNYDVTPGGQMSLDPALLRRFDRRILVDLPDRNDRTKYLQMRVGENKVFKLSNEQIDHIALRSTGMSLAELESVMDLALRSAIRDGGLKVTDEIFEEAFETFTGGEAKKWDAAQLERVARHEAGHAYLCWKSGETPSYLTIVARGNHGGYMQHSGNEGKSVYTKNELLARLRTALGGRASEIVYYGEDGGISTGASGDLQTATAIAQSILCTYGMDSSFGLACIDEQSAIRGDLSPEVRAAVNRILDEELRTAIRTISDNRSAVDALVEELLVKNHLTGKDIESVLGGIVE